MQEIELCNIESCTQCYACRTVCPKGCISFIEVKNGFRVPIIDNDACIKCGACMKVCHRKSLPVVYKKPLKNYACWTKNKKDRENSSSGGAFSVIAKKILSEGGIVYGASMCEDMKVRHIRISEISNLILLQGSKYVQSYIGDIYSQVKKDLTDNYKVLFSGTPCQVAGLYSFLRKDNERLLTCDVVCHGVPSQESFDVYLEKIGLNCSCCNFFFRYTKGWGFQLSSLHMSKSGDYVKKIVSPPKGYFLRAFNKGLMFSDSCFSCTYARPERISDFTLADYWGLGVKVPFNHSIKKGISCLLVNNEKALNFINECSDLIYEERPFEEAVEGNYNLSHVSLRPNGHDTYFEDSRNMTIKRLCTKYGIEYSIRDYLRIVKQLLVI